MNVGAILCLPLTVFLAQPEPQQLYLRGTHFVVYSVRAGETVEMGLTPRISTAYRSILPAFEVLDHRSRPVVPETVFSGPTPVSYRAADDGLNALVLKARRNWCRVDGQGRPIVVCARQSRPLHFRGKAPPIHFIVPKGVAKFRLFITCPDKREGATLRIFDPSGAKVFEETDWYHRTRRINVKVPTEQQGQVWSLRTANPREVGAPYAVDDVVICFGEEIPPFVATSPRDLVTVLLATGEIEPGQIATTLRRNQDDQ